MQVSPGSHGGKRDTPRHVCRLQFTRVLRTAYCVLRTENIIPLRTAGGMYGGHCNGPPSSRTRSRACTSRTYAYAFVCENDSRLLQVSRSKPWMQHSGFSCSVDSGKRHLAQQWSKSYVDEHGRRSSRPASTDTPARTPATRSEPTQQQQTTKMLSVRSVQYADVPFRSARLLGERPGSYFN